MRIGIPRALLYYQYYPMWQTFFKELGAEVAVSPPTTRATLSAGSARVVADTCLPVKVFLGHVLQLVKECDYVFIPAIRSVAKNVYNCSKFLGLPDMTRAVIPESPPILEIDIDINKGQKKLYQAIYQLGRHFTWNPVRIRKAALAAWQTHLNYQQLMSRQGLMPIEAIEKMQTPPDGAVEEVIPQPDTQKTTIALIGHPYMLYDENTNHRLVHRLEQAGCKVITPQLLTVEELESATARVADRAYWTCEEEIVGAGGHYLEKEADGVIGIMAFGCGPDSLMIDVIRRRATRLKTTPFMNLTLDEHGAEAGIVTRLEAFVEMIKRKKRASACV
ncbi:MAG: acyl-CoA dehydratase activase-related protein [Dehalococcoidales bacterium]|nr:acyl-CoA dehydratase activase-related protein [Dehalococcoidales bacterium]